MWVKQCHKPPMTGNGKHTTSTWWRLVDFYPEFTGIYPLVMTNIAIEHIHKHMVSFHSDVNVYQRVTNRNCDLLDMPKLGFFNMSLFSNVGSRRKWLTWHSGMIALHLLMYLVILEMVVDYWVYHIHGKWWLGQTENSDATNEQTTANLYVIYDFWKC